MWVWINMINFYLTYIKEDINLLKIIWTYFWKKQKWKAFSGNMLFNYDACWDTSIDSMIVIEIDFSLSSDINFEVISGPWMKIFIVKDALCFPHREIRVQSKIFCYVRQCAR